MKLIEEVRNIETESVKNKDWYYYGIFKDNYESILQNGIECQKSYGDHNGESKYYVSVYKERINDVGVNVSDIYYFLEKHYPMFVLDHIHPIPCICNSKFEIFEDTIIPLRRSFSYDEYQVFWKIKPEKIIGLECALLNWSRSYPSEFKKRIEKVQEILMCMKSLGIDFLPVYDNSIRREDKTEEVDKEGLIYLCRNLK